MTMEAELKKLRYCTDLNRSIILYGGIGHHMEISPPHHYYS